MPRALSLVIPEGLVVLAAVALARFGAGLPGFAAVAEWLPILVLLVGLGLCWRLGRTRPFAAIAILMLVWGWIGARIMMEMRVPLALAVSIVMIVTGWAPERGRRGFHLPALGVGILINIAALGLLQMVMVGHSGSSQGIGELAWTGLPDLGGGALIIAVLALLVASVVKADGIAQGALWATVATWGALVVEGRSEALIMVAGGGGAIIAGTLESLYAAAYRDALTGLPSRRALDERIGSVPVGSVVAMVDVDHFKQFNDTHGHDTGDQVLRMVAWRLNDVPDAEAFRYGGEEFALLFPGLSPKEAVVRLEKARASVAEVRFLLRSDDRPKGKQGKEKRGRDGVRHGLSVTISLGAAIRAEAEHPLALLKRADEALYSAKEQGRDRVVVAR
jgi:GGDEF domain-containing protein